MQLSGCRGASCLGRVWDHLGASSARSPSSGVWLWSPQGKWWFVEGPVWGSQRATRVSVDVMAA